MKEDKGREFLKVPGVEKIPKRFANANIVILTSRDPERVEAAKTAIEHFEPKLRGRIYYCGTKTAEGVERCSKGLLTKVIADNAPQLFNQDEVIKSIIFMDDAVGNIISAVEYNGGGERELLTYRINHNFSMINVYASEHQR